MPAAISELLSRLGSHIERAESLSVEGASLRLDWPELDAVLPDGGLPRGVVELAAPCSLGGGTSIALAAIRAVHARDARAWCAWVDPEATLYAPGVKRAGVDLSRLLFVCPPRTELGRIAIKVAAARVFDVIVIDVAPVPGSTTKPPSRRTTKAQWPMDVLVRKLALLAAEGGTTILLLTDSMAPRAVPWPVSLRLELTRRSESIVLRVAKDRKGRVGVAKTVPLRSRPSAREAG
jgi:hypothetical protein